MNLAATDVDLSNTSFADETGDDVALPTYAILARFKIMASEEREAVDLVTARLTAAEQPFHEVTVERREGDGAWMVVVRFVLVSVDGHTAVGGLDETLRAADLAPDEVWADQRLS